MPEAPKPEDGAVQVTVQPADTSLNRGAYVGTDPIYQNFANETDRPYTGQEEADLESDQLAEAGDVGDTAESEGDQTPSATKSHVEQSELPDAEGGDEDEKSTGPKKASRSTSK